jgi:hypothetical protein
MKMPFRAVTDRTRAIDVNGSSSRIVRATI